MKFVFIACKVCRYVAGRMCCVRESKAISIQELRNKVIKKIIGDSESTTQVLYSGFQCLTAPLMADRTFPVDLRQRALFGLAPKICLKT